MAINFSNLISKIFGKNGHSSQDNNEVSVVRQDEAEYLQITSVLNALRGDRRRYPVLSKDFRSVDEEGNVMSRERR